MTEPEMQTAADAGWIPFPTAEDALRARIVELETDLADERELRKEAQVTNGHLLLALLAAREQQR